MGHAKSGNMGWDQIFKAFKDIDYNGELAIECKYREDYLEDMREAKRFIETKWREA